MNLQTLRSIRLLAGDHLRRRPGFALMAGTFCSVLIALHGLSWFLLFFLCLAFLRKVRMVARLAFLLGALIACIHPLVVHDVRLVPGGADSLNLRVVSCEPSRRGWNVDMELCSGAVVRYSRVGGVRPAWPGDTVSVRHGHWRRSESARVPGSFDEAAWLSGQGVDGVLEAESIQVRSGRVGFSRLSAQARDWVRSHLHKALGPLHGGIATALLVGDRSGLDREFSEDFRATGIVHVLSVSGFHFAFLAFCLELCMRFLMVTRTVRLVSASVLLLAFVPIAGSGAPVVRSAIAFLLLQAGLLGETRSDARNSLAVAASLILWFDPMQVFRVGFQLSFLATFGLLHGAEACRRWTPGWMPAFAREYLWQPLLTTFWASLATLPVLAFLTGSLPLVSFLANLVAIPPITLSMACSLLLLATVSVPWLTEIFAYSCWALLEASRFLTRMLADLPIPQLLLPPPGLYVLAALPALYLLFPPALGGHVLSRRLLPYALFLFVLAWSWEGAAEWLGPSLRVDFLDVGQGDAILIEFSGGHAVLVDAGPSGNRRDAGRDLVLPYLRVRGIQRLDALVITHADLDHCGGAASVIAGVKPLAVFVNPGDAYRNVSHWRRALDTAAAYEIPVVPTGRGASWIHGRDTIRILHPRADTQGGNDGSLVLEVRSGNACVLLAGDLEIPGEEEILSSETLRSCDVLKLGHHGSRGASGDAWLSLTSPTLAIISAGAKNRYGHPHAQLLQRLIAHNISFRSTAWEGTLSLVTPPRWMWWKDASVMELRPPGP